MTTTSILRHINARRCLRLLRGRELMSRADLARELGLTRATVGNAIKVLLDGDLVIEHAEMAAETRPGRPGVGVALNPTGAYFVGVDVGTRSLTGVLLDLRMQVISRVVEPAGPNYRDAAHTAERLVALIERLFTINPTLVDKLEGVCVSVPGLVGRDGSVVNAPFLQWRDFQLQEYIRSHSTWDWPLMVCNDAFAFANAEISSGSAGQAEHLLVVLLNEGIGGAIVDDGRVVTGAHGYSGEMGHMLLSSGGRVGSFEVLAGAPAFSQVFAPDLPVRDGVELLLTRQTEPQVRKLIEDWASALAVGLTNAIHLIDPGRIVLGGPLAGLYPMMREHVLEGIKSLLLPGFRVPDVRVTTFGADGAAIGAAATVRDTLFALPDLETSPQ